MFYSEVPECKTQKDCYFISLKAIFIGYARFRFAGETALAFYTAKNPTDKPIDGISTYNVVPFEAGQV